MSLQPTIKKLKNRGFVVSTNQNWSMFDVEYKAFYGGRNANPPDCLTPRKFLKYGRKHYLKREPLDEKPARKTTTFNTIESELDHEFQEQISDWDLNIFQVLDEGNKPYKKRKNDRI